MPLSWLDDAPAGDVVIDPTTSVAANEDVWLESTSNYNNHSAGLLIGKAANYPKKRTVPSRTGIEFDIAGSGIPGSATVVNAQMKMYYYAAVRIGSTSWVDRLIHPVR